jgi:hypothetical protein
MIVDFVKKSERDFRDSARKAKTPQTTLNLFLGIEWKSTDDRMA